MPPPATTTRLGGEGELADRRSARSARRAAASLGSRTVAGHADARRRRPRARSPCAGRGSGPGGSAAPRSANGSTMPGTGAPGDVEAGHRVAVAGRRRSRRVRPTAPAGTSARPRSVQPATASRRRRSPRTPPPTAAASGPPAGRSRAAQPVGQRQLGRVVDPQPPLLGGVDQEQPAERPVRLAAERLPAARRRRMITERPASASSTAATSPTGRADDDDVRVHDVDAARSRSNRAESSRRSPSTTQGTSGRRASLTP